MKRLSLFAVIAFALSAGYATAVSNTSPLPNALAGAVVTSGVCAAYLARRRGYAMGADPAGTKTDGGLVFGSQIVAIDSGAGAVNYIAEDIRITAPTRVLDSSNQFGVPNKQALIDAKKSGTLTLQLADENTVAPARKAVVPIKPIGVGSAVQNYLITEVGEQFVADGVTKVTISVIQKLNA